MRFYSISLLSLVAGAALLAACGGRGGGGGADSPALAPAAAAVVVPEETRAHDSRTAFALSAVDAGATTFAPLSGQRSDQIDVNSTSRWAGVLGTAGYQVEVPADWNGKLVMYAHGFAGEGDRLAVQRPQIRRYLIQNGYAWAASSYSKNYYDVRAGVEDTNALALEFSRIAAARGRVLAAPSKTYITGVSMGGHIAAAAIEDETAATASNKMAYHGAVPICGVVGDTELFDTFAAMQVAAQAVAGVPTHPFTKWAEIESQVTSALFTSFPSAPTELGARYVSILQNLTGGPRPLFAQGLAVGGSFSSAYGTFGGDGTVAGILSKSVLDTNRFTYVFDGDTAGSAAINAAAQKLTAAPDANRLRTGGLRWIPKINGEFKVPVASMHTLGDLYAPFNMQQIYQKRVAAKGNSGWLVQRAIRGASHCDFTVAELETAFDDMIKWERDGTRPSGDDVVTPAVVAATTYGCTHTKNNIGPDDSASTTQLRVGIAQTTTACPP
ncbi:MAG: alpha/beta hydrolase [Polaromonas sp.]|nr:alpha/beta hydrolase [Polaromonas sp.]